MALLGQWEINVNIFLQSLGAWLTPVMSAVTFVGSEPFYIVFLVILYWCVDTAIGLRVALILMLSSSTNFIFKLLLHSPRPYWVDFRVKAFSAESSFGLPSGHSQDAMSIWGVLSARIRRKTGWIAALIILLMGISRMYLGVHFLRDVLLGWLIGGILLILFLTYEKPAVAWFTRQRLGYRLGFALLTALVMIAVTMIIRAIDAGWTLPPSWVQTALQQAPGQSIDPLAYDGIFTAAGTWFGILAGASLLAGNLGGHAIPGTFTQRVLRFVVGILGLFILYFGLGSFFPRSPDFVGYSLRFIRYALIGFWAIWVAPWLFVRLKLARPRDAV